MIFDFLLIGIAFYLTIPGVAGYCAKSYGRSFWKWFLSGLIFPIITHLILYLLIVRDIKRREIITLLTVEEILYMEKQIRLLGGDKISLSNHRKPQKNNNLIKE